MANAVQSSGKCHTIVGQMPNNCWANAKRYPAWYSAYLVGDNKVTGDITVVDVIYFDEERRRQDYTTPKDNVSAHYNAV